MDDDDDDDVSMCALRLLASFSCNCALTLQVLETVVNGIENMGGMYALIITCFFNV